MKKQGLDNAAAPKPSRLSQPSGAGPGPLGSALDTPSATSAGTEHFNPDGPSSTAPSSTGQPRGGRLRNENCITNARAFQILIQLRVTHKGLA